MACPAVVRLAEVCAFALYLSVAAQSQSTRSIHGMVGTPDSLPVGRADVNIDDRIVDTTGDSGGFHTPLQPPLRVGFPVTFSVSGWVVIDPCSGDRGREYLPDPDAEAIHLKVLRPGDPRLLKGVALTCLLEVKASHLPAPKKTVPGVPGASLRLKDQPTLAEKRWPWIPPAPGIPPTAGALKLTATAYHLNSPFHGFQLQGELARAGTRSDDAFLAEQAKQLGFSAGEINAAITDFSKSTDDPWQKGLAAIYEGRFADAAELIRRSIDASPLEIDRYVSLGYAEYMQDHFPAAEAALRKVLAVHPNDPMLLSNLGIVLSAEGKNSEAETELKQAITAGEMFMGGDSAATAQSRSALGSLYLTEGKLALAEPEFQKALDIDTKELTLNDPTLGADYLNLAMLYVQQGRFAEAETAVNHALAIDQTAFGADHPALVMDLFYQATAAEGLGKKSEAEEAGLHALKILHSSGEEGDLLEAAILTSLGFTESIDGRIEEAQRHFTDALAIIDKTQKTLEDPLGPESRALHSIRASILNGMGITFYQQRNYAAAESSFQQSLSAVTDTSSFGNATPAAESARGLGDVYFSEGQFLRAEPYYQQACRIYQQFAPGSLQSAIAMSALANLDIYLFKIDEAEKLFSQSLQIKEKILGKDSPSLSVDLNGLAKIYEGTGRSQQAEPLNRRALANDRAAFGPESASVGFDLGSLAGFYEVSMKPKEAEALYRQAIAIEEKTLGPDATNLIELYTSLARTIRNQGGRNDEAQKYDQRAREIADKARSSLPPAS